MAACSDGDKRTVANPSGDDLVMFSYSGCCRVYSRIIIHCHGLPNHQNRTISDSLELLCFLRHSLILPVITSNTFHPLKSQEQWADHCKVLNNLVIAVIVNNAFARAEQARVLGRSGANALGRAGPRESERERKPHRQTNKAGRQTDRETKTQT